MLLQVCEDGWMSKASCVLIDMQAIALQSHGDFTLMWTSIIRLVAHQKLLPAFGLYFLFGLLKD